MSTDYQDDIAAATALLLRARRRLAQSIADYPTPVSGCDVQYNHLLSDRRRVGDALARLDRQPFVVTPRIQSPGARVESR